jgi:hypothetical protein
MENPQNNPSQFGGNTPNMQGGQSFVPPPVNQGFGTPVQPMVSTSGAVTTISFTTKLFMIAVLVAIIGGVGYVYLSKPDGSSENFVVGDNQIAQEENKNTAQGGDNLPFTCDEAFTSTDIASVWKVDASLFRSKVSDSDTQYGGFKSYTLSLGCEYLPKDQSMSMSSPSYKYALVMISGTRDGKSLRETFELSKSALGEGNISMVSGVGSQAYTVKGFGGASQIHALSANEKYMIVVMMPNPVSSLIPIAKAVSTNINKY